MGTPRVSLAREKKKHGKYISIVEEEKTNSLLKGQNPILSRPFESTDKRVSGYCQKRNGRVNLVVCSISKQEHERRWMPKFMNLLRKNTCNLHIKNKEAEGLKKKTS